MITIRIKERDLDLAKKQNTDPVHTSIARYLNASWRAIDFQGNRIEVFSDDDELEGTYVISKEDLDFVKQIQQEWANDKSYFFSSDYEIMTFHIKRDKHGT